MPKDVALILFLSPSLGSSPTSLAGKHFGNEPVVIVSSYKKGMIRT
jgi:hypothetical protein